VTIPSSSEETIAAISTPPGPGAIGMVRITGPNAQLVGQKIFTPAYDVSGPLPNRKAVFGRVHPPEQPAGIIDLAVLCFFEGPRTYTGEDTVEITAHGGPLIMRAILNAAVDGGSRLAEPGEFTRRAFLNGRMDLSQAEAVASLIFASTEEARVVMLRQVEGAMGDEVWEMRNRLLDIKVYLEAQIDFPEDVEEELSVHLSDSVSEVVGIVDRLLGTARKGIALGEGFRVVIAGAPNVGKSCLLNTLLEEKRAIVHEMAGTTRDYVEGLINIQGIPVKVVDTAGIRGTADTVEDEGVRRTRELIRSADVIIILLDITRPLQPDEEKLLDETLMLKRVVAINKTDLASSPEFRFPEGGVRISALQGTGIEALKKSIHEIYMESPADLNLE